MIREASHMLTLLTVSPKCFELAHRVWYWYLSPALASPYTLGFCFIDRRTTLALEACFQIARSGLGPAATLQEVGPPAFCERGALNTRRNDHVLGSSPARSSESCETVELHARMIVPGAMHRAISLTLIPWRHLRGGRAKTRRFLPGWRSCCCFVLRAG